MAIEYKWIITKMDTATSEDGLTDVVKSIYWRYQAKEDSYLLELYGERKLFTPSPEAFIPYASLTEAQVIGWLEASLNVSDLQKTLEEQIQNLKNPPIVNLPLPWAN